MSDQQRSSSTPRSGGHSVPFSNLPTSTSAEVHNVSPTQYNARCENIELRLQHLENQTREYRHVISKLQDTVLGTLEGKTGLLFKIDQVSHEMAQMSVRFENFGEKLDAMRLNWAKLTGVGVVIATTMGLLFKLLSK